MGEGLCCAKLFGILGASTDDTNKPRKQKINPGSDRYQLKRLASRPIPQLISGTACRQGHGRGDVSTWTYQARSKSSEQSRLNHVNVYAFGLASDLWQVRTGQRIGSTGILPLRGFSGVVVALWRGYGMPSEQLRKSDHQSTSTG